LNSTELKQSICHQILGITHKDIEKVMRAVIKERQLSEQEQEIIDLESLAPEKFDLEVEFKVNQHAADKKKDYGYRTLSREDVATLLAISASKKTKNNNSLKYLEYNTYSKEEVQELIAEFLSRKK
jgi:hypothetical protein